MGILRGNMNAIIQAKYGHMHVQVYAEGFWA